MVPAAHLGLHYIKQNRSEADLKALIFVGSMGMTDAVSSIDKLIIYSILGGGTWSADVHRFKTLSFRSHEGNP